MDNQKYISYYVNGEVTTPTRSNYKLLKFHKIIFTEYHYKESGDTLNSKLNSIINLLNRFPHQLIEMWEVENRTQLLLKNGVKSWY